MKLVNDRPINLSIGRTRTELRWSGQTILLSEMYDRLKNVTRSTETLQDYLKMPKAQQDDLKDIGGFVGGTLLGFRRKAAEVTGRDLITLDFDNVPAGGVETIINALNSLQCGWCVYSTRKHTAARPRLRVVVPTDRTMLVEEYEPAARQVAAALGIDMCDPTTFDVARLMYWSSCCADGEFLFEYRDAELLSVDMILSFYRDWTDVSEWARCTTETNYQRMAAKQGDPTEKSGIVGAFCKKYDVLQAMDTFIPGVYVPVVGSTDRFTYCEGTTTGGAIIYDNGKFLYSHHATDPCSGKLVNAFDLIRLHKFGDKDDGSVEGTPNNKLPSYKAMLDWIAQSTDTLQELQAEKYKQDLEEFREMARRQREAEGLKSQDDQTAVMDTGEIDTAWLQGLDRQKNGQIKNTINNVLLVLENDQRVKDRFGLNLFASRVEVLGSLPWNMSNKRRMWSDSDSNGAYWFIENAYEITGRANIDAALDIHAQHHQFNEVQDYLRGVQWDGTERLDRLFIDYLGADDTDYNRAVCRKAFTAAVARAMDPGCKYDQMVILVGPQGIGKSTLLDKMSRGWFMDSLRSFEGKEASELLQGTWIVEIGELDAFRRSESSRIKQFLSQRYDRFRAAYARNAKEEPRRCVFFGTTNTSEFLQDSTGNRRFWAVDVGRHAHALNVWDHLTDQVIDQLWAEAKQRWVDGEELQLPKELQVEATRRASDHEYRSDLTGIVEEFAQKPIPVDWLKWDLDKRRLWWSNQVTDRDKIQTITRDRICALEIWCEVLGGTLLNKNQRTIQEINDILKKLPKAERSVMYFGTFYSSVRGFKLG